jgi:hypothetical protein
VKVFTNIPEIVTPAAIAKTGSDEMKLTRFLKICDKYGTWNIKLIKTTRENIPTDIIHLVDFVMKWFLCFV